jgi:hypothetical protein
MIELLITVVASWFILVMGGSALIIMTRIHEAVPARDEED